MGDQRWGRRDQTTVVKTTQRIHNITEREPGPFHHLSRGLRAEDDRGEHTQATRFSEQPNQTLRSHDEDRNS